MILYVEGLSTTINQPILADWFQPQSMLVTVQGSHEPAQIGSAYV